MKIIITILALSALVGCDDRFRYDCQDPKNFGNPKCEPPACEATGTCTKDLLGPPK
jgi:hypothetical protein